MKNILLSIIFAAISFPWAQAQEVGLQFYSLRNQFKNDVEATLDHIESWGIRYVEGGGTYDVPMAKFKAMLEERNLRVVSVGADFEQLRNDPQSVVENAKAFGAEYVVCFWIPHHGDEFTLANARDAVEVFNMAGRILSEQGLSLCYHPHGYEFRPHAGETLFDYIAKNTDPKYFNFEMDVFWIKHPGQDPVALLEKYRGRFPLMHLKDRAPGTEGNQFGRADVETNVVLGQGDVGIAEIMKAAKKARVKYYFIEDESSRSVEQIPQSLAFLRGLR